MTLVCLFVLLEHYINENWQCSNNPLLSMARELSHRAGSEWGKPASLAINILVRKNAMALGKGM